MENNNEDDEKDLRMNDDVLEEEEEKEEDGIFKLGKEHRESLLLFHDKKEQVCQSSFSTSFGAELIQNIRDTYERLGYVLIRGLLSDKSLEELEDTGNAMTEDFASPVPQFKSVKFGPIFSDWTDPNETIGKLCHSVAMESAVPAFIAKILFNMTTDNDDSKNSLRILNDVFLAKHGKEGSYCGWHVDDAFFWPCSAYQDKDVPDGVNAWIAFKDIPSKEKGGGMAIAPGSHKITPGNNEWINDAYDAIGSTKSQPKEGFKDFTELTGFQTQTCDLAKLNKELDEKFEATKKEFNFKKGDVLLMSRWLWHRSVQSKQEGTQDIADEVVYPRYTIRYETGNTRFLSGIVFHTVRAHDETIGGKSLDDICSSLGLPFFPKAWPESESIDDIQSLLKILPDLEAKKKAQSAKLFQMLKKA